MKRAIRDDTLGQRWLKTRQGLKLTQSQLAEKLEISAPYLSLIENDKRACPHVDVVRRLHQLSKVSLEHLMAFDL